MLNILDQGAANVQVKMGYNKIYLYENLDLKVVWKEDLIVRLV